MSKSKKVVVTGGAGFIGSHLANALYNHGAEVHVVDNLSAGSKERLQDGIQVHKIDIRNRAMLTFLFKGMDAVFHLAALPRVQYSIEHPTETNEVNIRGTLNVLEAARKTGARRVVFASSSSVYGNQEKLPILESAQVNPLSPYALQKLAGEHYCRMYSELHGLETVSLRYFNVYGPGMDPNGEYALVIGKFLKQRAERKPMTITGDGEQTRGFVHVSDVVRANILAAESDRVGAGQAVNIGAERSASVNEIAALIGGPVKYIASRIEPKHVAADVSLASSLLGWQPAISLEEGLSAFTKKHGLI